jgi:hypothetical protein
MQQRIVRVRVHEVPGEDGRSSCNRDGFGRVGGVAGRSLLLFWLILKQLLPQEGICELHVY